MVGYFLPNGRNVLWGIPERPEDFLNLTFQGDNAGTYAFGQQIFSTRPFGITSIFRRNVTGGAEEFLLGALSVLLIAVLSEIVQAILMHTRSRRRASKRGVKIAFLVDEFYHFRNVWSHMFSRASKSVDPDRRRRTITSLTILCIALGLMAADVLAVYLTQPIDVFSVGTQYNLRGFTPTFTDQGLGRFVRRLSRDRPCVTPTFNQTDQTREFTLSSCLTYDIDQNHNDEQNFTGTITVGSWFHKGGSDHNVTFGNSMIYIKARTFLYVSDRETYRVLYNVIEEDDFRLTRFLHELFIHNVLEISCNNERTETGFQDTWCPEILDLMTPGPAGVDEREIIFWRTRFGTDEAGLVRGWVSNYNVTLQRPMTSVDNGVSPLVSTSWLQEVEGPVQYVNFTNEAPSDHIEGLLKEEGRVAGLIAMIIVFVALALMLLVLRLTLRPSSLGSLAWAAKEQESDTSSDAGRKDAPVVEARSRENTSASSLHLESAPLPDPAREQADRDPAREAPPENAKITNTGDFPPRPPDSRTDAQGISNPEEQV